MLEFMHSMIFQLFNTLSIVSTILTTKHLFVKTVVVTIIVLYFSFNHSCCYCMSKAAKIGERTDFSSAFNSGTSQNSYFIRDQTEK